MKLYPWYDLVNSDEPLCQGDLIRSCPLIIPNADISTSDKNKLTVNEYDVIIMSQTCDIVNRHINIILVCPFYSLQEASEANDFLKGKNGKEQLRRGNLPGYHLLNKCDEKRFESDFLVVDFRNVYGVHFDFLIDYVIKADKRLRLLPPYREHLSQAFARFFMRVGLPVDIPAFS